MKVAGIVIMVGVVMVIRVVMAVDIILCRFISSILNINILDCNL